MEITEYNNSIIYHKETVIGIIHLIRIINDFDLCVAYQVEIINAILKLKKQGFIPLPERNSLCDTEKK